MGMGNRAHIVTPSITARGLLNMSALAGTPGRPLRLAVAASGRHFNWLSLEPRRLIPPRADRSASRSA